MVQILPLIGAAALLAQTAFGAAVPMKRGQYNNNYNSGSSQQDTNQYANQYQPQQQQQHEQQSQGMAHEMITTVTAERAMETTVMMQHEATTTTAAMAHETTAMRMEESSVERQAETTTSPEMAHETSSVRAEETTTSVAYAMPSYGSGSSPYQNNGYNDCVSQCMAQFGAPPSTMTMEGHATPSATGTGAVHTVLVAPAGAGLRYMPFAVNATVGDTVRYVWTGPNNHTATLSSALSICNKSGIAEQRKFVSGIRNASAGMQTFDVVVETAEPQFFYCSVAQHCSRGMFGIINPANSIGAPNTVGTMMASWLESDPNLQAAYQYANISESTAKGWGMGMSLDGIPESAYKDVAANILFTQATFAANPGMVETGLGAATPDGSPIKVPTDLNVLLTNTNGTPPTSVPADAATFTPPANAATGTLTPVQAYNGASKSSAGVWVAAVVGVAGWLLI